MLKFILLLNIPKLSFIKHKIKKNLKKIKPKT